MEDNQREEISYLAGLFDGEGTICIQKDTRPCEKENGKGWNPIYTVCVRIGMIDEKSIRQFQEYFKVGYLDCEKSYHKKRPMYRWTVRAKEDVISVLEKLSPFLRLKYANAQIALRFFLETPSKRGQFLTPELLEKKEHLYQQMRVLNGVDISPATTKRRGRPKSVRV